MEEKSNEATPQRPLGDRLLDAAQVVMDLPMFIAQIKQEEPWHKTDRNAITIFKTEGLRLVLIALHEGALMKTHTAPGIITVQVLEGELDFATEKETSRLAQGQVLALHAGIPHSVLAVKEAIFLLTLAGGK